MCDGYHVLDDGETPFATAIYEMTEALAKHPLPQEKD